MVNIARYSYVLQDTLSVGDTRWSYTITDLPSEVECDQQGYIKSCRLSAHTDQQNIVLTYTKVPPNRAISQRPLHCFVHVTCSDFRLRTKDSQVATFRESADYIARFLKFGILINGSEYHFYGHSNSQLKSRSCFFMKGSKEEVDEQVEHLGDFSKLKSVAKKAKRIGLLFSTAHVVLDIDPKRCRDIADIDRNDYTFTDGCGNISVHLARSLAQKKPIFFRNKRYHPSVFQIRYRGYKGVVTVNPRLKPAISLELRKSMQKFAGADDLSFAVVEHSKPYTYGYLNDETVLLLHALGIKNEVFKRKLHEHIDFLDATLTSPQSAFRFLSSLAELELAEKVLLDGIESVHKPLRKLVAQEHTKMLNKHGEQKCRILIPKSRLLFGVCDPEAVLKEGECFIKPTNDDTGIPHTLTGTYVLVARNPCLHPGDLQKLRVVVKSELSHLTDCIVFATKGKRPAADMMSGGDLDGDTFFVSWDPDITPKEVSQPAEYPGAKEPIQFKQITSDDRIDYFSRSSSMQLGQIKNLFLRWARLRGPLSSECQELNRLFSQCVDANRIKIPDRLLEVPSELQKSVFVLDELHEVANGLLKHRRQRVTTNSTMSRDVLVDILSEPKNITQFELAQLTVRWCYQNNSSFDDFWHFIDSTQFSTEERAWFFSISLPQQHLPELLNNDMMHSDLLLPAELKFLGLRSSFMRWRCIFSSPSDRLANLLDVVNRTFCFFTRKLLVLQIHERLSIAIYLPKIIEPGDEFPVNASGRLFAFAHDKDAMTDARVVVRTKHNACLYYDHNTFQLYEGKRRNTFVYLTRAANDDSTYRNLEGKGRRARAREQTVTNGNNQEWRTSIALNKFSQGLARHVGRVYREGVSAAELYVISNTDTRSQRNLDMWLEQIDTDKVHRNFESEDGLKVEQSQAEEVDWSLETDCVRSVVKDQKISEVNVRIDPVDLSRILELSWNNNYRDLGAKVYSQFCSSLCSNPDLANLEALSHMIDFLARRPELVIYIVQLSPWSQFQSSIRERLVSAIPQLIRALILCANKVGRFAATQIQTLLTGTTQITIRNLGEFAEIIALTVNSAEAALDLFMEGFQPLMSAVVLDTPRNSDYLLTRLAGIVVEHIDETCDSKQGSKDGRYEWTFKYPVQNDMTLTCDCRIDAPKAAKVSTGDHVKFISCTIPEDQCATEPASFEALVRKTDVGTVTLHCLRHPPAFYQSTLWTLENYGPFATTQTAIDAVVKLMVEKKACCEIFQSLFPPREGVLHDNVRYVPRSDMTTLNESQCRAVISSMAGALTCIWGPPGTGKTFTLVTIVREILLSEPGSRLIVTAPTHNAVDNVMRQFLKHATSEPTLANITAIRVSTDVHKVSSDLRSRTCDAMLGKDINLHPAQRRKAQKQITNARLIFSTCIGAGLGLLRNEHFENVIIDEASQQTEPVSLVPLVKGCRRAILVGDHVQLRATVRPNAQALGLDISLFERLWTESEQSSQSRSAIHRVMLDTQYRMHPSLCEFPSRQFYDAKLKTAEQCSVIKLPPSQFPWPNNGSRNIFIQVPTTEDLGRKSKSNIGQAKICAQVIRQLLSPPLVSTIPAGDDDKGTGPNGSNSTNTHTQPTHSSSSPTSPQKNPNPKPKEPAPSPTTIAILTPYTRQVETIRSLLSNLNLNPNPTPNAHPSVSPTPTPSISPLAADIPISTIDAYQGQEATIIIYVTVRSNVHRDLGFLRDMRRLNVAVTRAKAGLIVIGDEETLVGWGVTGGAGREVSAMGSMSTSRGGLEKGLRPGLESDAHVGDGDGGDGGDGGGGDGAVDGAGAGNGGGDGAGAGGDAGTVSFTSGDTIDDDDDDEETKAFRVWKDLINNCTKIPMAQDG